MAIKIVVLAIIELAVVLSMGAFVCLSYKMKQENKTFKSLSIKDILQWLKLKS